MNHQAPNAPAASLAGLSIPIIDRPEALLGLPWDIAWMTYKVLQALGREDAFRFVRATITMFEIVQGGSHNIGQGRADNRRRFDDELFYEVWQEVADKLYATDRRWTEEIDQVLHFTYILLHSGRINREHAAAIASTVLQQHVTTEAWRKRMERWTHAHGLPPVRRKRGRPPKYNSDAFG